MGDNPAMTPGSLESASLTTWTTQLTAIEATAAEREKYGADLVYRIAEPLKQAVAKFEELRKNHAEYAAKLEKERDSSYGELKKIKGKYDGVCQEVENRRKKVDNSFDYGKQKAQNAYHQQIQEMNNVKVCHLYVSALRIILTGRPEYVPYRHQCDEQIEGKVLLRVRSGTS